jgi:hypothetical protein
MWTWTGSAILSLALMASCQASPLVEIEPERDFAVCRSSLREGGNPGGKGGWILIDQGHRPLLCLSGSLEDIDVPRLLERVDATPMLDVSVRSTGGPVGVWLQLAERLIGRINSLYVDEACFSSCANYLVPLAREVIAGKNSLVVWHGGPNPDTSEPLEEADVADAIEYDALAERTRKLYVTAGVDVGLLSFTATPPSRKKLSAVVSPEDLGQPISGYAVSPRRLSECFGFRNLGGMWHAGNDKAVYALGKQRSARLAILESPSVSGDGTFSCGKPSAPGMKTWRLRGHSL